ncbi:hypothetical protein V491_01985 [Pseudogymnoascus sp. VKM F-3775]|nr:hypothetical protein V491_01985 [Pseudogymnoascus sp. VKM F-3775]
MEYSEAFDALERNPWNTRWSFPKIVWEIREYGSFAKMIMLHVAFWYNPDLKEPHPREADKKPIYEHLEGTFRRILPKRPYSDPDKYWKTKALALQRTVIDFIKANGQALKGQFMIATLRFYQMPKVYHERFSKGTFWDRLARDIRYKMPEISFQHPDLLPYNSDGDNIYHFDQRPTLGTELPTHPVEYALPVAGLVTGEGTLVTPEIVDLIGQEYGSDTSSIEEISGPNLHDDEAVGIDTEYYDTPSSASISTGLGKRKNPSADHSYKFTPDGSRRSKIIRLSLPHTTVASEIPERPSASASDASQTLKNGRRDVDYFREQVRRQSFSPSASANDRQQSLIDPIPPPKRGRMMTNLPDDVGTPLSSTVTSTANRRRSVRSTSQSPALTAPQVPMFSAIQESTPVVTTETLQAATPLSEVKQAVKIVLDEFVDKLTMKEQVAAINIVRSENTASVFVMLPAKLRKAWLFNEIGK